MAEFLNEFQSKDQYTRRMQIEAMVARNAGFTEKDITDFWESFKLVDEDNNGEISYKELGVIL